MLGLLEFAVFIMSFDHESRGKIEQLPVRVDHHDRRLTASIRIELSGLSRLTVAWKSQLSLFAYLVHRLKGAEDGRDCCC